MNWLQFALALPILLVVCSCSSIRSESDSYSETGVISVSRLLDKRKELQGQQIRVVGYFDSHFEGSSLRSGTAKSSPSIQVPNYGGCPVVLRGGKVVDNPDHLRWDLMPVLIVGRFWITDLEYRGLVTKGVSVIEPNTIVSIPSSELEKLLKTNQGADQPAAALESKPEGKEKSNQKSEGRPNSE